MNSRWTDSTRHAGGSTAIAAAAILMFGCTSMGSGTGNISPGDAPVTFAWTSKDGGYTGTMSAKVSGGDALSGPFLQMTSAMRTDTLRPLWTGWRPGWIDWDYWGPYPDAVFARYYSGKVVANLKGPDGQRLRCRLDLNDAEAGMSGGGQGECQFTEGRTVDVVFARS